MNNALEGGHSLYEGTATLEEMIAWCGFGPCFFMPCLFVGCDANSALSQIKWAMLSLTKQILKLASNQDNVSEL